jgi:hypothetical protein
MPPKKHNLEDLIEHYMQKRYKCLICKKILDEDDKPIHDLKCKVEAGTKKVTFNEIPTIIEEKPIKVRKTKKMLPTDKAIFIEDKPKILKNKVNEITTIDDTKRKNNNDKSKKQLRHSSYFITINTNQRFNPLSKEYEDFFNKFKITLNELLNNHVNDIIGINEGEQSNVIKNVKTDMAIELAPNTNCVHSHIMMDISHYSSVKLNYQFIKDFICQRLNLSNIYLNNKVVFGTTSKLNLKDYIEKSKYY